MRPIIGPAIMTFLSLYPAEIADAGGRPAISTAVPPLPAGLRAPPGTGGIMIPPGDADEAIRSEYRAVERKGSRESYAIFAERHPDHPLAREAQKRAAAMTP